MKLHHRQIEALIPFPESPEMQRSPQKVVICQQHKTPGVGEGVLVVFHHSSECRFAKWIEQEEEALNWLKNDFSRVRALNGEVPRGRAYS